MAGKPTYEELEQRVHDLEQAEIERRQVENELRISEKLLRNVMDIVPAYGNFKNHGGFINVYSEKGEGAKFNVYLPASEKEVIQVKMQTGNTIRGSETILFVDDEDMVTEIAEEMFESVGYKVLIASSVVSCI